MRKEYVVLLIICMLFTATCVSYAGSKSSSDLLKQGLLGAGAGAVGGAASGAKGKDVWKGALAGAGVNIVGGMLLDSMTGEKVEKQSNVQQLPPQDAYQSGYTDGFNNGYKQGYTQGYKEGLHDQLDRR